MISEKVKEGEEEEQGVGGSGSDNMNWNLKLRPEGEGAAALKGRISEKLKELMGDYTDETLVDYVMVLLWNGRRKVDAAKELRVFLGDDDSLAFVSWLWDHLSSNLQLYCPPAPTPTSKRFRRDSDLEQEDTTSTVAKQHQKPPSKRQKIVWEETKNKKKEKKNRPSDQKIQREEVDAKVEHQREGRPREFPLRSVITSVLQPAHQLGSAADRKQQFVTGTGTGTGTSTSSLRPDRSRPLREDHPHPIKRELPSRPAMDAPRRLLQFAVRDAVKPTLHVPSASTEPVPITNRLQSVLSAPPSESLQVRDESRDEEEDVKEEDNYSTSPSPCPAQGARPVIPVPRGSSRLERSSVFDRLGWARGGMRNSRSEFEEKYSSDSASDKDGYDMVEYSVAQEKEAEVPSNEVPAAPASQIGSKPSKILNISVNVNTWKSPGMVQETHSFSLQNNQVSKAENTEVAVPAMLQNVVTKTPTPAASRSLEDPDCRTLFVSNVHFGATKDALSRHFNKFGAVLKVIILADVNTGQPTGSAYVEFLQKESAEAALSLNGTSFMSRILKVVRKNSQEAGPTPGPGWGPSRGAHVGSFPARPIARLPYLVRGRAPVRGGGVRSMQWRRGGQSSDAAAAVRSFTYTRVPSKAPGQS